MKLVVSLVLACLSVAGCSTKAWYGGLRASAAFECDKRPPTDRDSCRAQLNKMSYEQYEKQRTGPVR